MIEIEKYPCKDANEALARERHWFERLNSSLNGQFPQRKRAEYRIDNKGIIKEKAKEYNIANKDIIAIKKRAYKDSIVEREKAIVICECGSSCSKQSISSHIKTAKHKNNMEAKNVSTSQTI
jgi:hypothetical protein